MEKKQVIITPNGMQKDIAVSQFPNNAAYDLRNFRIVTTGDNTTLCLTNEKSNKKVLTLEGTVIGVQTINQYAVIFTTDEPVDRIYFVESLNNDLQIIDRFKNPTTEPLFEGILGFSKDAPIESIGIVETNDLFTVYWLDGINKPRLINIGKEIEITDSVNQFDFQPSILNSNKASIVEVEPIFDTNGSFDAGVLQYCISYFNKYGQSSSVLYCSSFVYTSDEGRGLNPDGTQKGTLSFKITITDILNDFDYVKLYRIYRTSIDQTPVVTLLGEYSSKNKSYIDSDIHILSNDQYNKNSFAVNDLPYSTNGNLASLIGDTYTLVEAADSIYTYEVNTGETKISLKAKDSNGNEYIFIDSETFTIVTYQPIEETTYGSTSTNFYIHRGDAYDDDSFILRYGIFWVTYDTNTTGSIVDASELLYLGGDTITASTMAHKDGTLFLGNITIEEQYLTKTVKEYIKEHSSISFVSVSANNSLSNVLDTQYYYNSNLNKASSDFTFYQKGETYRFGVQFLSNKGKWSDVVYLGDYTNDKRVVTHEDAETIVSKPMPLLKIDSLPDDIINNYNAARLVAVYPTINDRTVLCQGIICPTVYNVGYRQDNAPYVQSSWFARPNYFGNLSEITSSRNYFANGHIGVPLEYRMFTSNNNEYSFSMTNAEIANNVENTYDRLVQYYESSDNINLKLYSYRPAYPNKDSDKYILCVYFTDSTNTTLNISDFSYITVDNSIQCNMLVNSKSVHFDLVTSVVQYPRKSDIESTKSNVVLSVEINNNIVIFKLFQYWVKNEPSATVSINYLTLENSPKINFLPAGNKLNSEIYCAGNYIYTNENRDVEVQEYKNLYGVEQRIVTMHSPELDVTFNDDINNISLDGTKFRIVGFVRVKNTMSDISVTCNNPMHQGISAIWNGYIENKSSSSYVSGYSMVNFPFWIDDIVAGTNQTTYDDNRGPIASFPVYPWQRNGSLSNQGKTDDSDNRKSVLTRKVMSNLRSCLAPVYFDTINGINDSYKVSIEDIQLFNGVDSALIQLEAWGNKLNYYGDVDQLLAYTGDGKYDECAVMYANEFYRPQSNDLDSWLITQNSQVPYLNSYLFQLSSNSSNSGTILTYNPISELKDTYSLNDRNIYSSDAVPIKYRSTSHAVLAFTQDDGIYNLIPNLSVSSSTIDNYTGTSDSLLWLNSTEVNNFKGVHQESIISKDFSSLSNGKNTNDKYSYYYILGELYRDTILNRFGGDSEEALANNTWNPCSNAVPISTKVLTITGNQGDTMLGKYDHLKSYAYATEDLNSIVDIVSFYCETRVNVDGRYDKNRGNKSNLAVSPTNFNLFNKVYSQRTNFFTYNYYSEKFNQVSNYPNQIVWTNTKTNGEQIDSWTTINTINSLDLDGDKGNITAIRRINNEIYVFQERGISRISYNSRVQINTSDGVPIELANSNKVTGKIYISNKYGCQNKWSIVDTNNGIYFIDDLNSSILVFDGSTLTDLSYTKNMFSWIKNHKSINPWTINNKSSIRTLYDSNDGDIYFTTDKGALSFNSKLGAFSSFYSYENVSFFFNLEEYGYQVQDNTIWKIHEGEGYGNFFGTNNAYSIEVIANSEFQRDKTFETVEFRTNGVENLLGHSQKTDKYPFYELTVDNEYQWSIAGINNLRKKFRTWRWQIAKDTRTKTLGDRIRNPWTKIKMVGDSSDEVRLYDLAVTYYV